MATRNPKRIDKPWGEMDGVTILTNSRPIDFGMSLQRRMMQTKPVVLALKIHQLSPLVSDFNALNDGDEILLRSNSDGAAGLTLLNLRTFTCRQLDDEELKIAEWPSESDSITYAAMHTGLAILVICKKKGGFSLLSFSLTPKVERLSSPAIPDGFDIITTISIDKQYICIAGHFTESKFEWGIVIWDRSTQQQLKTLTGPPIREKVVEWVEVIVMQKGCIVAVTVLGHLFYWDKDFAPIENRSSGLTEDVYEDVYIDSLWLSQDLERVVMMNVLTNDNAAMVLDNGGPKQNLSFIPAVTNITRDPKCLRMDADCQTVVRGWTPDPQVTTPQFEVYSISESQPCFRVESLSASTEPELGSFMDVLVNDYALTLFGTKGAIQIRFIEQNTIPDETRISSQYLPLDRHGWAERDVQKNQETIPASGKPPQEDAEVYDNLDEELKYRQEVGEKPHRLIVISDGPKDYDDLMAWVIIKWYDDHGFIVLEGIIANLYPSQKRAQFTRGALDELGLKHVPVAVGTDGTDELREVHPYEFDLCDFMATEEVTQTGQELLLQLYQQAERNYKQAKLKDPQANKSDYQFKILLLSSLRDIDIFAQNQPSLFKDFTSEVVLQGGCFINPKTGILEADSSENNRADPPAANRFYRFMQDNNIRSTTYTREATFETPIGSAFFDELAAGGHPIGIHLKIVQLEQDYEFLKDARDVKRRFRGKDEKWVFAKKSTWYENHSPEEPFPKGEEARQYLKIVTAYDALAAVASGGDGVLSALNIPRGSRMHECIGVVAEDGTKDFNKAQEGKYMSRAIRALMRGVLVG